MRDFSDDLEGAAQPARRGRTRYLQIDELRGRLAELETEVSRPDLWDDQERAKQVNGEYASVKDDLDAYDAPRRRARGRRDAPRAGPRGGRRDARSPRSRRRSPSLDGELDAARAAQPVHRRARRGRRHLPINAKDGGVDAQDWAEMLLRMYVRWAERRGFDVEVDDVSEGTEAGILSAEFTVKGRYAYGLMQAERGMHRLVRISPFDGQGQRQTSFAAVEVWPVLDDAERRDRRQADIRMDVFRASGAGGQHVNKTSSAVRLTHLPTGHRRLAARTSAASSRTGSGRWRC